MDCRPFYTRPGINFLISVMSIASVLAPRDAAAAQVDDQLQALARGVAEGLRGKTVHQLAVLDFDIITEEQSTVTKYVTEIFITHLVAQSRTFKVIDRAHLSTILEEADQQSKLAKDGILDKTTQTKLAIAGLDAIIIGKITVLASGPEINMRVLDVKSATILDVALYSPISLPQFGGQSPLPKQKETPREKELRQMAEKDEKRRRDEARRNA